MKDSKSFNLELRRKLVHISGIIFVPIFITINDKHLIIILLFSTIIILLLISYSYKKFGMFSFLKLFERVEDLKTFPAKGAIFFFLGLIIVAVISDIKTLIIATLILSLSDGFSTIVGKAFGKRPLPYNKNKTLEGTIVFFLISFLILINFYDIFSSIIFSLIVSIVESLNLKINDNLSIPVTLAILIEIYKQF